MNRSRGLDRPPPRPPPPEALSIFIKLAVVAAISATGINQLEQTTCGVHRTSFLVSLALLAGQPIDEQMVCGSLFAHQIMLEQRLNDRAIV